jgi:hypothetical protein
MVQTAGCPSNGLVGSLVWWPGRQLGAELPGADFLGMLFHERLHGDLLCRRQSAVGRLFAAVVKTLTA